MSYTYEQWKKEQEEKKKTSYTYDVWKAEQKPKEDTESRIQEKMDRVFEDSSDNNQQKNKNLWDDIKGIASNFTRSLGNLAINAYENVGRVNSEYMKDRNELIEKNINDMRKKALEDGRVTQEQFDNAPTLESIANNSEILKTITGNANKIIQPMENKFKEWEKANNEKIQENIDNASNSISKKILEVTPSIAQSSVNLIPGGNVLFSAGITQNYYEDAKQQKGMTDEEASKYASIMAILESGTEMIGARLTKNVGKSLMKGKIKSALANYGLDIGENFLEEAVMEPLGELTTTAVAGKEKTNWEDIGQRSFKAGIDGAITSVLMGGASAGVGSAVNVVNKISNNQKVTQEEIKTAVKDTQISGKVDVENIVKKEINNISNLQQSTTNNNNNLQTQQTIQEQNQVAKNSISEQTEGMLNNKELPLQSYQYEQSDNVKINNLRQDANRYFNNSEKARNYVSMLEKIVTDKNIEIRLDGNLKTADGRIANGSYSNGVITINPNSTRAGEFIAIHELTHAIGTKEMLNMVNTYRNSNPEFDTAVKGLLQNYQGTEISEEALADISGQLFGNQEFINNIAQNNPNIFQKLYSEIKYLWHQFRGYKNQNQFVEDLYYKWTQAYNRNNKLNETSNYSIAGIKGMNNAIKQDTSNLIIEQSYNRALQMAKNNIDNEVIRKNTGWFQDRNGDWKFEFSDKNMSLKTNIKLEKNKTYKLSQILEHDTLFEVYPELANYNVKIFSSANANGSFNKSNKTINISDRLINNKKLTEGTLIHEIQHAIQNIEGFERGKSSNKSRLAYYNSLGEIEASNTKDRFVQEKYNNKNLTNIAPESSKTNPKHKNLDNYLKNRNLLDKVKDSVYNYFNNKNGGKNNEINQEIVLGNTEQDSPLVDERGYRRYVTENSNESSFSMQDNQGRILTKEQQEFFKDSKVRDENGNLKTMYHGSNNRFSVFKHGEAYRGSSKASVGYWFTETAKGAENFANSVWYGDTETGAKVYEVYLNIKKPKIYEGIDNTKELNKIDNEINILKETIRKLENKNIAIEINKQELRWANSKEELMDIAKYEGIDLEDAENYHNAINQYNDLIEEYDNKKYNDSYELFRADIYKIAGKSASEANIGGTGMYLNNEEEVVKQYVEELEKQGYDGIIIKNTKFDNETLGKDNSQYVVFNSNQIKNVDNTNPTSNPDIRYSQNNQTWQQYLDKNFKPTGTRTSMQDILPTAKTQNNTPKTIQEAGAPIRKTEIQNISYNLPIDENTKARKHYKSIIQSQYTTDEARAISKELMGADTYVPESNNKQLERADERISLSGADNELSSLMSRAMTGGNIKADDIAVGERLIQYYSKTGNKEKLQEAIQATAIAGTTAGQTVQAMSLLNHQTPQGQAVWLQRSVDKMNNELVKRKNGKIIKDDNGKIERIVDNKGKNITQEVEIFNLTSEMVDTIVNSENNEQLQENLDKVYKQLGQQVTKTTAQKIDSWRYFAMLANPRTHIRNIIGNTAMGLTQSAKNKIAGGIEGIVSKINPDMERTHTLALVDKKVKDFAKADIKNVADRLGLNENKYNPKTRLENNMRTFKIDVLEKSIGKAFEINNKALEVEDGVGLKFAYVKALSEYMTANKLTPENITDKQLAKARNHAVEQAQEATFHQNSSLSTLINQLSNKNKFSKFMTDSILPFKKTPINVAKSGIEYSPIGLIKSAVYDSVQLRKGNITINKYIDNISKGLTGTGIALVGYALARAGILKASGSDDKDKENFDQDRGSQTYSIQIGENTYSLDWIAPSGIPLFVGAECYEIMQREKEEKSSSSDEESTYSQALETATNILDAFTNAMNPMTEMSMLSGLSSALKSYEQGASQVLASFGTNAVKSYVNQFIPTALGQVAKTTDEYERSTTSTKTGTLPKAIDSTKNYAMSKIPGLRQMLPIKTDIWGNELKQSDNVILRGLENAVFPWTRKELNSTDVDKELINVYENTGESSVLPDLINKNLTIDKEKYVMTSEEYAKYKNTYGETSYSLLNNLIKSNNYKNMNDAQKQYAIEKVYEYAKEQIKVDYAKNNNLKYEESKLSKTVDKMKKSNGNISNYFEYLSLTQGMNKTSEKINILTDSNYTNQTKQLIYENNLLEEGDLKYDIIKTVNNFNIESYLEYKLASSNEEFKADRKDDGTLSGKTISGSAKNKKFNYISNMKNTPYMQKLIMFGLENTPSSNDKAKIVNYITTVSGKTNKEKLEMLDEFSWITIYKDSSYKY